MRPRAAQIIDAALAAFPSSPSLELWDRWKLDLTLNFKRFSNQETRRVDGTIAHLEYIIGSLHAPLSLAEIGKAILSLSRGKTPGPDGLPGELYRQFSPRFAPAFHSLLSPSQPLSRLPPSMLTGRTVLIPKRGDSSLVENLRPITLMNADYKVLALCLANRLLLVLPQLIHPSQTAFIKHRKIGDTINDTLDIMDWAAFSSSPLLALTVDFRKAYDLVDRPFLLQALSVLGLPASFIHWVRLMHSNTYTRISVNNRLGPTFPVRTGVRQGCPLAPLLFVCVMEIFHRYMSLSLPGFALSPAQRRLMACYADDVTLFLTSDIELGLAAVLLGVFGSVSGEVPNWNKCSIIPFNIPPSDLLYAGNIPIRAPNKAEPAAASINPSSAYLTAATHQLAASQSVPGLPSASASLSAAATSINPSSAFLNAATHQLAARISPSAAYVHVSVPAQSRPAVAPGWTSLPPAPSALSPSTSYINPEFHPTNSGQPGSGLIPPASATPAAVVAPPATQLQPSGLPWTLRVRKQKSALPDPGPSHVEAGSDEDSDDDESLENQAEHGGEQRPVATSTSRAILEAAQAQIRQKARRIAELENQLPQQKGPHAGSHAIVQRQANLPSPSQQLPVAPQLAPSTTRPCTQPNATHPLIFSPVVWPRTQAAFSRAVAKAHIKRQAIDCSAMSPRQCGWYNNVITALDAFPDVHDDLKEYVDEALDIMFFDTPVTDFTMWPSTERLEAALRRALGLTEPEEHFIVRIVLKADKYRNGYIRDLIQAFRNDALTDGRNWVYDAFDLHVPRPRLGGKREGTLTTVLFLDLYAESEYDFTLLSDPRPYPTKVTARS
ncbi:unnamed protein product [Closterium sp. Yama58-4]|nr:unnamed protein product [Closterium sp. Yama58-4]